MLLHTRVTLASLFAGSAVLSTILAWHAQHPVATQLVVAPMPIVQTVPAPAPPPPTTRDELETETVDEPPGPQAPIASVGPLELGWMPEGYVRDVGPDKTESLAQAIVAWATTDSQQPRIEYRKGVVFARSTEDRGDDGPYPRSAGPRGDRVCGEASVWLRQALRQRLEDEVLTCDRNVCSYGGMEYAPDGYLVFREIDLGGGPEWALDAWVETYRAALDPATAARNQAEVVHALRHELTTSCAGEPTGAY